MPWRTVYIYECTYILVVYTVTYIQYIHMYICMYTYICQCMHIHVYLYWCINKLECIHKRTYTCMHSYVHICIHIHINTFSSTKVGPLGDIIKQFVSFFGKILIKKIKSTDRRIHTTLNSESSHYARWCHANAKRSEESLGQARDTSTHVTFNALNSTSSPRILESLLYCSMDARDEKKNLQMFG